MDLTVGELKRLLNMYPDDYPVEFQHINTPDGREYRLTFYRIKNRGVCHFEWNSLTEDDELGE